VSLSLTSREGNSLAEVSSGLPRDEAAESTDPWCNGEVDGKSAERVPRAEMKSR
jgi:hypothetical protein